MTPLLAALAAMAVLGGLGVLAVGLTPAAPSSGKPPRRPGGRGRLSSRTRLRLLAGLAAGLLVWLVTGWVVAVLVLPAAVAGLPVLLITSGGSSIARLEAMEEWTRNLAGTLTKGVGLEQALIATQRSTPAPIHAEVDILTARLRARWTTETALRAFADDLDDATGDLIAASLVLASLRGSDGIGDVLEGLADTVTDDVRIRRAIEADRSKPRSEARYVTLITLGVLVAACFTGKYIQPYSTGLGQAVLLVLLSAYAGALLWLRAMASDRKLPRFLGQQLRRTQRPA